MWQKRFEKLKSEGFTIVAIAMDVEGVEVAKRYYQKYGVEFHALVDPNYATRFGYVPWTFFVDEHGVVQPLNGWEQRIEPATKLKPVTDKVRAKFTDPAARLSPAAINQLVKKHEADPKQLGVATELASRYLLLDLKAEARAVLAATVKQHDARRIAKSDDKALAVQLANAHLQLSRAFEGDRDKQVEHATLSFYLNPSVGFGKQIARIIAPEKFDGRSDGRFDNAFREGTLRRLRKEREQWLQQ